MKDGIKGYKFEEEISKNGSSKVFLATKIDNGKKYAIKKIDKSYLNDKHYKKICKQRNIYIKEYK